MENPESKEPIVINTHHHGLRGHFEYYETGEEEYENGEPEYNDLRVEIADHYGVPYTEEGVEEKETGDNHIFVIDNKKVEKQRRVRAFCVILRDDGKNKTAWYIDGRTAHATMLNRLYNYYGVPRDEHNQFKLGFLDVDGFEDVPGFEKFTKSSEPVYWFVRETVSPSPEEQEEFE